MSCEHTTFSLMLVNMPRGKRLRSQTKEVVVNIYDYFEELGRCKQTEGSLKKPLMPQNFHVPASRGYGRRNLAQLELPFQLQQRDTESPDAS